MDKIIFQKQYFKWNLKLIATKIAMWTMAKKMQFTLSFWFFFQLSHLQASLTQISDFWYFSPKAIDQEVFFYQCQITINWLSIIVLFVIKSVSQRLLVWSQSINLSLLYLLRIRVGLFSFSSLVSQKFE